jgi:predicted nucleotidyltransferase
MSRTRDDREAAGRSLRTLVDQHRDAIKAAAARHHGQRVRLYGSVARGQEHAGSDIDLLVDFTPGSSLFDLMHLNRELEELLGHSVDVVSRGGLKERDRTILDEAIEL